MRLDKLVNNTLYVLARVGLYGMVYSVGAKEDSWRMPILYASEALSILSFSIKMIPKKNEDNLFKLK